MPVDPNTLPEPVRRFVTAVRENALKVDGWATRDLRGGQCFADTVLHVRVKPDGRIVISDNYEKLFLTIYEYAPVDGEPNGFWQTRVMYLDEPAQPYTFEQAMADASIMFTG